MQLNKIITENFKFLITIIFGCGLFYSSVQAKIDDINELIQDNISTQKQINNINLSVQHLNDIISIVTRNYEK